MNINWNQHQQSFLTDSSIVNIHNTIQKLRHGSRTILGRNSGDWWPEPSYIYRERNVHSDQLWLHNIVFYNTIHTFSIIELFYIEEEDWYYTYFTNTLEISFNSDLNLRTIRHASLDITNFGIFNNSYSLIVINYIDYIRPLLSITSQKLIATVVARLDYSELSILKADIVSISEFRKLYTTRNNRYWWYQKILTEQYRAKGFEHYHKDEIFKAINYKQTKRVVLALDNYVYLEIIIVKINYFRDIDRYYNQQIRQPNTALVKPHTWDRLDSVEDIITEFYIQQHD